MRTFFAAVSALALLASLGAASAQTQQQPTKQQGQAGQQEQAAQGQQGQGEGTGVVGTVGQTRLVLVMDNGEEYTLAEGELIRGLTPGTKVKVTYTEQNGQRMVTNIEPAGG